MSLSDILYNVEKFGCTVPSTLIDHMLIEDATEEMISPAISLEPGGKVYLNMVEPGITGNKNIGPISQKMRQALDKFAIELMEKSIPRSNVLGEIDDE